MSVPEWLGPSPGPLAREEALARLARRYLRGHGPATAADLARWAGLPPREARSGLTAIAGETEELGDGLLDLVGRRPALAPSPPQLLGAFDPLLLGWVSRQPFVGEHADAVVSGGVLRPFAHVDGRVVATWRLSGTRLDLAPLEALDEATTTALDRDGLDVLRYLHLADP